MRGFFEDLRYAVRGLRREPLLVLTATFIVAVCIGARLTRYVRFLVFGITELDGWTFALTPVLLAAIVAIASLAPARRALEIDPLSALREE